MIDAIRDAMKTSFVKHGESWKTTIMVSCMSVLFLLATSGCNKTGDTQTTPASGAPAVPVQSSGGAGAAVDDNAITRDVKKALSDNAEYKFESVDVATVQGTVQLSGTVDTEAHKKLAGELASGVPEVKGVTNNISLKQ